MAIMKKIVSLLLVALAMCVTSWAKSDVQLESGSLKELKKSDAKVLVVWDYSQCTLNGKEAQGFLQEKGEDWVRDYNKELEKAELVFLERLKDKSGDINPNTVGDYDYKMVIRVTDFHYGSTALGVVIGFGAGNGHVTGKVEFYKKDSTETIAVLDVNGVPGGGMGNEVRRIMAYRGLADHIAKMIKKGK